MPPGGSTEARIAEQRRDPDQSEPERTDGQHGKIDTPTYIQVHTFECTVNNLINVRVEVNAARSHASNMKVKEQLRERNRRVYTTNHTTAKYIWSFSKPSERKQHR